MIKGIKSTTTRKEDIKRDWHLIDASGMVLGRVATDIAGLLIGKHKASYTPNLNVGDKVVVTNVSKIAVTGNKKSSKVYYRHSGYPGSVKSEALGTLLDRNPSEALRRAVKGMLPKNKLTKARMKNLHIYTGSDHPHSANFKNEK